MAQKSKYGYLWVTLFLFLFSMAGHWALAWFAYLNEQEAHHQPVKISEYVIETGRDTLENWQSEFLQLIWQVAGLTYLWYVGSPQSKEGEDRMEAKLDLILKKIEPARAEELMRELNVRYPKR